MAIFQPWLTARLTRKQGASALLSPRNSAGRSARSRRPLCGGSRRVRCARRRQEATRHRLFVCAASESPGAACTALAVTRPMCVAVVHPGRGAVAGGVAVVQGAELWRPEPGLLVLRERRRPGALARVVQHLRRARDARAAPGEAGCGADGSRAGHSNRQARRSDQRYDRNIPFRAP